MKASDLREKSDQELGDVERQLRDELFRMKMKHYGGQLQSVAAIREKKRAIARVKTVLHERRRL